VGLVGAVSAVRERAGLQVAADPGRPTATHDGFERRKHETGTRARDVRR
jgi:hypothetical protein